MSGNLHNWPTAPKTWSPSAVHGDSVHLICSYNKCNCDFEWKLCCTCLLFDFVLNIFVDAWGIISFSIKSLSLFRTSFGWTRLFGCSKTDTSVSTERQRLLPASDWVIRTCSMRKRICLDFNCIGLFMLIHDNRLDKRFKSRCISDTQCLHHFLSFDIALLILRHTINHFQCLFIKQESSFITNQGEDRVICATVNVFPDLTERKPSVV